MSSKTSILRQVEKEKPPEGGLSLEAVKTN